MLTKMPRRIASSLLTILAASFIIFLLVEASPGNVARKTLGPFASEQQVSILYDRLHLNDPLLMRYGRWLGVLVGLKGDPMQDPALGLGYNDPRGDKYFGNLGQSTMLKMPVADVIWVRLGNSLKLAALAFAAIVPLAILIGTYAGLNANKPVDRIVTIVTTALASVPEFASAVILASVFVVWLGWLPGTSPLQTAGGWPIYLQYILPVIVLMLYVTAYVTRFVRTSVMEVMQTAYVRTAILKGLSERQVVGRHVLRNAMLAPFTIILLQINWLISGVVVTEVVFAYPGIGRLLLEAALFGDIAVIEAASLITVSIAIATQMVGDVGYVLLNPRIRLA